MSQGWKWGLAIGVLIAFGGLIFIPSAFVGPNIDTASLAAGLAIFTTGVLAIAISFYFEARFIRSQLGSNPEFSNKYFAQQSKVACDVCHKAAGVIQCTMHKTVLCSSCLSGHYDSRACVYVPSARRTSGKTAKAAVASRR
jgi:hypothetical protein